MNKYIITCGLGFGDEGKGSVTDYLVKANNAKIVVRYNGGAQAFHTVYHKDIKHIFRQFGSGTFHGAQTLIGPEVVVNPLTMAREAGELEPYVCNPLNLVTVSENALIVTPYHRALNIIREYLRVSRHGSTGMGIGETRGFGLKYPYLALRAGDLKKDRHAIAERLELVRKALHAELAALNPTGTQVLELDGVVTILNGAGVAANKLDVLADRYVSWASKVHIESTRTIRSIILNEQYPVIFEGAQGVLLDQRFGFHPHTTWSDTTPKHALELIANDKRNQVHIIGITRTFATRHGAGPLVSEGEICSDMLKDDDNPAGDYQGGMRSGALDAVSLHYAIQVCKEAGGTIDSLAVTHCDKLENTSTWPVCVSYVGTPPFLDHYLSVTEASPEAEKFTSELFKAKSLIKVAKAFKVLDELSNDLQVPIAIKSYGKSAEHKLKLL